MSVTATPAKAQREMWPHVLPSFHVYPPRSAFSCQFSLRIKMRVLDLVGIIANGGEWRSCWVAFLLEMRSYRMLVFADHDSNGTRWGRS